MKRPRAFSSSDDSLRRHGNPPPRRNRIPPQTDGRHRSTRMTFTETPLEGAWIIDIDRIEDERGFFARAFSPDEFAARGLDSTLAQCNVAWNHRRGTIRGMHFQRAPMQEVKIVRCTAAPFSNRRLSVAHHEGLCREGFRVHLVLGYKGSKFASLPALRGDAFGFHHRTRPARFDRDPRPHFEHGWRITLVDTGLETNTGGRVKRASKYLEGDRFLSLTVTASATSISAG